jgi:hypothetical protein
VHRCTNVNNATKAVAASERMRTHRSRRRNGFRCVTVLLHEVAIDVLIRKGLLPRERCQSRCDVENALDEFVRQALDPSDT